MSAAAIAARHAHRESVLKDLAAIPRDRLSSADRLNYDLFRHQYQMTVEGFPASPASDPHVHARRRAGHRVPCRFAAFSDGEGLRRLAGTARRVSRLHGSEHRADARGHEDQRAAAEDHRRARAAPDCATGHAGARRERLLPSISQHANLAPCRRPRAPDEIRPRSRAHARAAGVREAARVHGSRVPSGLVRRRGLVADEQRARGLSLFRAVPHDDRPGSAGHSRARPERSGAHPRRDGGHQEAGRIHGHARRSSSRTSGPIRNSSTRPARSCSTDIAPSRSASIPS